MFDNRYLAERIKRENEGNPVISKYMDGPLPEEITRAQLEHGEQSEESKNQSERRGPNYERLAEVQKSLRDVAKREKSKKEAF